MDTICCIATGPSLTLDQIAIARSKGYRLFGCNVVYRIVPDLELLYGCNLGFWRTYWSKGLREHPAEKWTTNREAAHEFKINLIAERDGQGLCEDPWMIHHGHGSGFSLLGMAHKSRAARIVLLGYDLKYAPDYDGRAKRIGSKPRHFFGEYPEHLQHWPSVQVKDGVHIGLLELYRSVARQGLIEIVNATPDSALDCFPTVAIEET